MQEGSVWGCNGCNSSRTRNLKLFVDCNGIQNDDFCEAQMRMFDIPAKWNAFGWAVKVIDGHDMTSIVEQLIGWIRFKTNLLL